MLPTAQSLEGRRVPTVTFQTRINDDWNNVTTDELFKDSTVVAFALPGAYTPTCSSSHLPRYNELADTFRKLGVDRIVCLAVNDAFVMAEWKKDQDSDNVMLIPDGNGEFAAGMGMLVDKSSLGFGMRSWRYSMLVKDGVIEKMFIEPDKDGDPFEVSDADTMLQYIKPGAVAPQPALVFARPGCRHCARAMALLDAQGQDYDVIEQDHHVTARTLRAVSGSATWPQVFIAGKLIGNADDLEAHYRSGKTS